MGQSFIFEGRGLRSKARFRVQGKGLGFRIEVEE
jgi:hypothetical protein